LKPTRRWLWPVTVVLICFAALVIGAVVHRALPNSPMATTVTLVEKVICAICALSGLVGLVQRPRGIALVVCVLGVIVGILFFLLILAAESFSAIFV
jgi:hypothetical protein